MNIDLRMRLTPFKDLDTGAGSFWITLVYNLFKEVHSDYKVTIEVREITEDGDDTAFVTFDDQFTVVLDDRMPFGMVTDYLIHELAHVGSWDVNESDDHGPHFGIEYAKLYRRYLEIYEEYWS